MADFYNKTMGYVRSDIHSAQPIPPLSWRGQTRKANFIVTTFVLILLIYSAAAPVASAAEPEAQYAYNSGLVALATGETQQLSYNYGSYTEASAAAQVISNTYVDCRYRYPEYFSDGFKIHFEVDIDNAGTSTLLVIPERSEESKNRQTEAYVSVNWFLSELYKNGKLSKDMSEFQRSKVILDWVAARVSYDKCDKLSRTSWSAINRMKANCNGYTALYNQMLRADGIQCHGVLGYANGGSHLWSVVTLDGVECYTDATWYDSSNGTNYFALTRSQMEADHAFAAGF